MRAVKRIPRILRAKSLNDLVVSAVFNNGETRIIDFRKIFADIDLDKKSAAGQLYNPEVFKKFNIKNHTLSWKNVEQEIPWGGTVRKLPFEIGADTIFKYSKPADNQGNIKIGDLIRKERRAANLTQSDLAKRSGTTAGYISRLENNKSDIEFDTLQKLVKHGLRKRLYLGIR
jgi:DNA-binding XRE family transcriptional regulator